MAAETERRAGSGAILWLPIGFMFLFAGAAQQQFQSPFWNTVTDWRPVQRSVILATVYVTFGFWRLRIGWFIHRFGEKTILIAGAVTYLLFCLAVWATTNYGLLLLAAAIWGWGAAANWGTGAVMTLDFTQDARYGASTGRLLGLTRLGFALGVLLLAEVSKRATAGGDPMAGRAVWLWAAGLSAIGVICLFGVPSRRVAIDLPSWRLQWSIMSSPKGSIAAFFLFLSGSGFGAVLSVLSDQLATAFASGNKLWLAAWFSFSGYLINVVGGRWSDRVGRPRAMFWTFTLAGIGLCLAWLQPESMAMLAVCAFLLGLESGFVPTLTLAMIGDLATSERRQNAYAALFFWRDMGVASALLVSQQLQEMSNVRGALGALAVATLVCAGLATVLANRAEAL